MKRKIFILGILLTVIFSSFILGGKWTKNKNSIDFYFSYNPKNPEDKKLLSSQNTFISTCRRFPVYQFLLPELKYIWRPIEVEDTGNYIYVQSIKRYDFDKYFILFSNFKNDLKKECIYTTSKRDIFSKNSNKVRYSLINLTYLSQVHGENTYPTNIFIESALEIAREDGNTEIIEILEKNKNYYSLTDILQFKNILDNEDFLNFRLSGQEVDTTLESDNESP